MPRLLALVLALAAAIVLGASQVSAGITPMAPFTVKGGKSKDGPFVAPTAPVNIEVGKTKTRYWQIKNQSPSDLPLTFDDGATPSPNPEGFKVLWYKGKKDVTAEVKGDGKGFVLPEDGTKYFRATVKHVTESPGFCLEGRAFHPIPYTAGASFRINDALCE